jgi:RimJ/RimL family protein N-acetyltransferase
MLDYGFENFNVTRIFARPFGSNIASQKALEKAGFKLEAKFEQTLFKNGKFEDELVYAVRRVNHES